MSRKQQEPMAYIGRRPTCGHIVFAVVDIPEKPDRVGRDVASAIRQGLKVERVTCQAVREAPDWCPADCPHAPKPRPSKAPRLPDTTNSSGFSLFSEGGGDVR